MALRWFGGKSAGMVVADPTTGAWLPGDAGTVWLDEAGASQVTELVDENMAPLVGGAIYADNYGYPQLFGVDTDPATEVVWVDFTGAGERVRLECRDRASYRVDAATLDDELRGKLDRDQLGAPNGAAKLDDQGRVLQDGKPLMDLFQTTDGLGTKADKAVVEGLSDQLDQVQAVAATTEEIGVVSARLGSAVIAGAVVADTSASHINTVWTAPYDCQLVSAWYVADRGDSTEQTPDYYTLFRLGRREVDGVTTHTIVGKATTDEPIITRVPWAFDPALWDDAAATFTAGESLYLMADGVGGAKTYYPSALTFRVVPVRAVTP